ncbi:hypothetical protein D3C85_673990 [compost metagenome]
MVSGAVTNTHCIVGVHTGIGIASTAPPPALGPFVLSKSLGKSKGVAGRALGPCVPINLAKLIAPLKTPAMFRPNQSLPRKRLSVRKSNFPYWNNPVDCSRCCSDKYDFPRSSCAKYSAFLGFSSDSSAAHCVNAHAASANLCCAFSLCPLCNSSSLRFSLSCN